MRNMERCPLIFKLKQVLGFEGDVAMERHDEPSHRDVQNRKEEQKYDKFDLRKHYFGERYREKILPPLILMLQLMIHGTR